jgi:hypothetical protein
MHSSHQGRSGGWLALFLTKNNDEIVKKRDRLRAEMGIKVATLPLAVIWPSLRPSVRTSDPTLQRGIPKQRMTRLDLEPFWEPDQSIRATHQRTSTVLWLQNQA